jgi:uncharacterized delta-60 repeat protein
MRSTSTLWCRAALLVSLLSIAAPAAPAQTLDPTFTPTVLKKAVTTSNFITRSALVQPDGKVVTSGDYDFLNGSITSRVRRLNADGSLDTGFLTQTGFGPDLNYATALALQADGKILAGGQFQYYNGVPVGGLVRLNADGSVDTGFNAGGTGFFVGAGGSNVRSLAMQPDGKILVGGTLTSYNGQPVGSLVRLNSNGSIDNTFTLGGSGIRNASASGLVDAILVQADGSIVVGGSFTTVAGAAISNVVRFNPDGSLDNTFAIGAGANGQVRALLQQPDGKLVLAGLFTQLNGVASPSVVRLNLSGSVDNTFQGGTLSSGGGVYKLRRRSDGSLLVAGSFTSYNGAARGGIARVSSGGVLDAAFPATTGTPQLVYDLLELSNGQLLAGGAFTTFDGASRTGLVRLSSAGAVDASYTQLFEKKGQVLNAAGLANGQLLVSGDFESINGTPVPFLSRVLLNTNGNFVSSTPEPGAYNIQPDGRGYTLSTSSPTQGNVTRYLLNGSVDPSFSSVMLGFTSGTQQSLALIVAPNGQLLVSGSFNQVNGQSLAGLVRINAAGTVDATFTPASPWAAVIGYPFVDAVLANGQVLVRWSDATRNYLARLNNDGSLDNTFSVGSAGGAGAFFTSKPLPNGKLLVSGNFTSFNGQAAPTGLIRLNANGSPDPSFTAALGGTATLQPDGRILLHKYNLSNNTSTVRRLNADGSLDTSFSPVTVPNGYFIGTGLSGIVLQPADGRIMLFGGFTSVNGQPRIGLARLTNTLLATRPALVAAPELDVFPNPAHQAATLRVPAAAVTRTGQVLDALGREVLTFQVPAHATQAPISLSGLPTGLYVLRCGGASQKLVVE